MRCWWANHGSHCWRRLIARTLRKPITTMMRNPSFSRSNTEWCAYPYAWWRALPKRTSVDLPGVSSVKGVTLFLCFPKLVRTLLQIFMLRSTQLHYLRSVIHSGNLWSGTRTQGWDRRFSLSPSDRVHQRQIRSDSGRRERPKTARTTTYVEAKSGSTFGVRATFDDRFETEYNLRMDVNIDG